MNRKAFTLIELLVVVAIIGILAAVGVVAYNGYTSSAKIKTAEANLKTISSWLSAESTKVCSAQQGQNKNGMFFEDGNYKTFMKCDDDGTALAYAASQFFYKNEKFKNPYNGQNAIPDKAVSSSYSITRNGLQSLSSTYVSKGEIMFLNLGGELMTVVLSNVGDQDGNNKNKWVIIPAPSNF